MNSRQTFSSTSVVAARYLKWLLQANANRAIVALHSSASIGRASTTQSKLEQKLISTPSIVLLSSFVLDLFLFV